MSSDRVAIRLNVFAGLQNLPNYAAEARGFFAARGLDVMTTVTRSSQDQRNALASGDCDIAHSASDNSLAMVDAGIDVALVVGLDNGFNKIIAVPGIETIDDVRGKTLGVDALDTAFALLVYEILRRRGLRHNVDYHVKSIGATRFRLEAVQQGSADFTILNLPFNLFAQESGLKVLIDPIEAIGSYQGTGGFVRRDWAAQHRDRLLRYLAAYVEGLRWVLEPNNRASVVALLEQRMELSPEIAAQCYEAACDPRRGFARDAKIDQAGMECVLKLRDTYSPRADGSARPWAQYVDEGPHAEAISMLKRG